MKKIAFASLLFGLLANSCSKSKDTLIPTAPAPSTTAASTADLKPTASFNITNLVSRGVILEGNINDFDNQSFNANTYLWEFGNGLTSTDRIPKDVSFVPCGGVYNIRLTVTNKSGVSASTSQSFTILCRGKNAHNSGVVHLSSGLIPAYVSANE